MNNLDKKINLYGFAPGSIVDGPGIRFTVFMQGCSHHCPGCHNVKSQAHGRGKDFSIEEIIDRISQSQSSSAVTLSGGEPFDQIENVSLLAENLKNKGYNIWCYTGYTFENLLKMIQGLDTPIDSVYCNKNFRFAIKRLLKNIDVLVDGRFEENNKSYAALFRGSTNQRLINVEKSLENNKIVLWTNDFEMPSRPSS